MPPVGVIRLASPVRLPKKNVHALHDGTAALGDSNLRADLCVHPADVAPKVGAVLVLRRRRPEHHRVVVVDGVAARRGQPLVLEVPGAIRSRRWHDPRCAPYPSEGR